MKCPYCQHPESRVLESRPTEEGSAIRRRRACQLCDERFTTYERVKRFRCTSSSVTENVNRSTRKNLARHVDGVPKAGGPTERA